MSLATRVARTVVVLMLPLSFGACEWFTDFKTQPSIEPWESPSQNPLDSLTPPRGQPQYSVPIQGTASPAFGISHTPSFATVDSMSGLQSPGAAGDASMLDNGKKLYQINCAVCHGMAGAGGPSGTIAKVNPAYGISPSLLNAQARSRSEGYIFGIIRNGRGLMPSYNRIEENERWAIASYVKALQAGTADTTLVGYPGQNGNTVPRASLTAPTRPAPYMHPGAQVTPGSPNINSATYKGRNDSASTQRHE
jgi:mono/diheme cytochrome c family protein